MKQEHQIGDKLYYISVKAAKVEAGAMVVTGVMMDDGSRGNDPGMYYIDEKGVGHPDKWVAISKALLLPKINNIYEDMVKKMKDFQEAEPKPPEPEPG